MTDIRGIKFGPVWGASGVQGFFGEGYWYHWWFWFLGLCFDFMTFVAKTTTLYRRVVKMPLGEDGISPRERFPACIKVKWFKGVSLNAVSLSGPGADALLQDGRWQQRKKPFFISFMSVGEKPADREKEFREFLTLLSGMVSGFSSPFGLQVNLSCPNTGHEQTELVAHAHTMLDILMEFNLACACIVKVSAEIAPKDGLRISQHPRCDGLCISNAIKFGLLPDKIDWKQLFGSDVSPLASMGGGGLSGKPLLPLTEAWVREIRRLGMNKHINAGGGVLHPRDVDRLFDAGADSVFLGAIAFLRPWRVRGCISRAYKRAEQRLPNKGDS